MMQRVHRSRAVLAIAIVSLLLLMSPASVTFCGRVSPCSHFVDNSVSQDGDGSETRPWDNIAGHVDDLEPGDVMCVRGDSSAPGRVYTETTITTDKNSGTEQDPITVRAHPSEHVVIRGTEKLFLLDISGVNYWQFDGFIFDGEHDTAYAINFTTANFNTVHNCEIYHYGAGIRILSGDYNTIENCRIRDLAASPHDDALGVVIIEGHGNVIRGNEIYDIKGDCVYFHNTSSTTISGTIVEDNHLYTTLGSCSENAIDVKKGSPTIRGNVMHGFRYCDGSCGGSGGGIGAAIVIHMEAHDILIESNEIYDSASGITLLDTVNATIVNNLIHDLAVDDEAWANIAIFTHFSTNVDIINNTFANIPRHVLWISLRNNFDVRNNLFHDTGQIVVEDVAALTADYNGWFSAAERIEGPNDITGTHPRFVLPGDYHLQSTSPAVDAGTDVGVTTDFEGDPRPFGSGFDIGADEYVPVDAVYLPVILRICSVQRRSI